ncbi:alpha/beta fold hydrolase [Shewanella corallii]|uniref:Alpha/beta fold hydrolase n=1 Tax=Shewanella corallii TaxID=560080 RepID=A0ABT0ND92_9GAMM|nr:alpha/beta fold hydrolase [Shewanella corallii]MCL2916448.1 alpha/beta fold hydrolase [Shewanella corallii]
MNKINFDCDAMKIILLTSILFLQGCANQAFFSPQSPTSFNTNITMLESDSGNRIASLLLPGKGQIKGIVLHFHGNSGHMEQTQEKVDWLTEHGFDVLVFDYSGFGHSEGQSTDVAAVADSRSMLKLANQLSAATGLPVYAVATSTGANLLIRAMADSQLRLDGIIIDSGFTSYTQVASHVLSNFPLGGLYAWFAHVIMRDEYAAGDDARYLPQMPALVVHCKQDKIVPFTYGEQIFEALPGDKAMMALDDCAHARGMTRAYPQNQQQVVAWLEQTAGMSVSMQQSGSGASSQSLTLKP